MGRLNMTLSDDTERALARHAKKLRVPVATFARTVLCEGLAHREILERKRQLAKDYAAGRTDTSSLLDELSELQLEIVE
jgi:hypothetical protein